MDSTPKLTQYITVTHYVPGAGFSSVTDFTTHVLRYTYANFKILVNLHLHLLQVRRFYNRIDRAEWEGETASADFAVTHQAPI